MVSDHDLAEGLGDLIQAEERSRTWHRRSDSLSDWEDDTWSSQGWNDSRPFPAEDPLSMILLAQTCSPVLVGPWFE